MKLTLSDSNSVVTNAPSRKIVRRRKVVKEEKPVIDEQVETQEETPVEEPVILTEEEMKKKKARIEELVEYLSFCNNQYYIQANPVITDYNFDQQLKELEKLEKQTGYILPYSPTQKVGSDLQTGFKEVPRTRMMGSIENCYEMNELTDWLNKFDTTNGHSFLLEPKYDGTSCSIIYEDGIIKVATTRGSGLKGADITANVKTIRNVPLKLAVHNTPSSTDYHYEGIYVPNQIEIRGEILLPKSELVRINKERELNGEAPFANERNCAAGSIKQLDPRVTSSRHLIFKPYAVYSDDDKFTTTYLNEQHKMLDVAEILGFDSPSYWRCADANTVIEVINEFHERFFNNQDYKMDGCVVKLDSYEDQISLGYTQKVPKWAKAFKFEQERASTKLLGVDIQMGMSGQLGFVANLEPVEVDGTVISRATLNNPDFIKEKDLMIGQYVFIEKGGAVIPNLVGVDYERTKNENCETRSINIPEKCPFCGEELTRIGEDGANLYCNNDNCIERIIQKLIYFVRKDCMNIDGVGEETIRSLCTSGIVRKWEDLYDLTVDGLIMNGFGEVTAKKMINQIEKSKTEFEADRSLAALGIRMIGKISAKKVMEHFKTIESLKNASLFDINAVDGIGEVAANCLYEYVSSHQSEFDDVIRLLPNKMKDKPTVYSNKLFGQVMIATGTLKNFTREGIEKSVIENGGVYASGVSRKVTYLIVGENPGASKIQKAEKNGVQMIREQTYLAMIR